MVAKMIKEFCDEEFNLDKIICFEDDYSGRFMYGKKCIGIYTEENLLEVVARICDYLHENGIDNAYDALGSIRSDQLGLGMIIYFPTLSLESE